GGEDWAYNLGGSEDSAYSVLWAAAFEPGVRSVLLDRMPATDSKAPALLNVNRVLGGRRAVALLLPREVMAFSDDPAGWDWPQQLGKRLHPGVTWLRVAASRPK